MEEGLIKLIADYGILGMCVFQAYILWKLIGNHLNHNTDALNRVEIAITKLNEFLQTKLD
jgi:uncharacterized protein (DUF1810 family)